MVMSFKLWLEDQPMQQTSGGQQKLPPTFMNTATDIATKTIQQAMTTGKVTGIQDIGKNIFAKAAEDAKTGKFPAAALANLAQLQGKSQPGLATGVTTPQIQPTLPK